MPSGYTEAIAKGISFKEFAMSCAKAFGACVSMRDDPADAEIPEFKPSEYHVAELKRAKAALAKLKRMTAYQASKAAKTDYEEDVRSYERRLAEKKKLRDKYSAMIKKVSVWTPPSSEHLELKKFMLEQLSSSIDFDCDTRYMDKPVKLSGDAWLGAQIKDAYRDIDYHTKEQAEELERVNGRNNWVKLLRESLKGVHE
jgi:hypothetical protein